MKKLKADTIVNILMMAIISFMALYMFIPLGLTRSHTVDKIVMSDTVSRIPNMTPVQAEKTSCDICRKQQDSLDRAHALRNGKFRRDMGGPFGQAVRGFLYTDAEISSSRGYENNGKNPDYFFALPYWDLAGTDDKHGIVKYYVKNKQAYINAFDYTQHKPGTRKSKEVFFKYDPTYKQILILVSGSQ
ncbi:hypothetical protein [Niabella aurantiaca]|uniref:hypothetical protein n=1 Tax=Niabella aurantiaca TaxID=379900 RepID=UPI000476AACD|nr:hypothetical protein [Niabella aurantiaca]